MNHGHYRDMRRVAAHRDRERNIKMNAPPAARIFIVEDDRDLRDVLAVLLTQAGYQTTSFADAGSFLAAAADAAPDLVLLDIELPGLSGLDTLVRLDACNFRAPVVILSGKREIPVVVDAMKRGAHDFIEKPFTIQHLTERVRAAIEKSRDAGGDTAGRPSLPSFAGRELLTPREFEVLAVVVHGASSKEAGRQLGISPRTVEVHRSRIMEKLRVKNTAALIRIVFGKNDAYHRRTQIPQWPVATRFAAGNSGNVAVRRGA